MYDAIYVLAHAIQQVDTSTRLRLVNLSCEGDQAWAFGSSLYNYLNLVSTFTTSHPPPSIRDKGNSSLKSVYCHNFVIFFQAKEKITHPVIEYIL